MPEQRRPLTRADLPENFTADAVRRLPLSVLRRLAKPDNGVLDAEEQRSFDTALHEVMTATAGRVSRQIDRSDWAEVRRNLDRGGSRRAGPGGQTRADEQLRRLARRIDQQVDVAETLAPAVDWSFAQPSAAPTTVPVPSDAPDGQDAPEETGGLPGQDTETVSDLEQRLTEQVELIQVMSEIADVGKRTFALEQQRDLQNTRGVFFGFVVSVAVLVAGWAPLVAAEDWAERAWVIGLTVGTCVLAGAVYALVRRRQVRQQSAADEDRTPP